MSTIKITAPVSSFTGQVAGVQFVDGVAEIEIPRQQAAAEYFGRHGYGVHSDIPAPKGEDPALAVGESEPQGLDLTDPVALEKLKGDELDLIAANHPGGPIDLTGATKKADKAALIVAAQVAYAEAGGEGVNHGPVGPTHNQGRDGADPDNHAGAVPPVEAQQGL